MSEFLRNYEPYDKEHVSELAETIARRCRHYGDASLGCYIMRNTIGECPVLSQKKCSDVSLLDWEPVLNTMPLRQYISLLNTFLPSPYARGARGGAR